MTPAPLVSVVMPAYRAEKTLAQAVNSVLAQSYPHFELLILDDCSPDRTAALAQTFCADDTRVKLLANTSNLGVARTRMRGAQAAAGEWLAFLDSDDAWTADKLEKQLCEAARQSAELVFTGSSYMDETGAPLQWVLHVPPRIGYRQLLRQNVISNSSVLMQKQAYLRCAVLDDSLHEDYACWLRYLKEGHFACGIDEPLLIYRLSAGSKSGNKLRSAQMNWRTLRAAGLNAAQAGYYMGWYTMNGVLKYRNIRGGGLTG